MAISGDLPRSLAEDLMRSEGCPPEPLVMTVAKHKPEAENRGDGMNSGGMEGEGTSSPNSPATPGDKTPLVLISNVDSSSSNDGNGIPGDDDTLCGNDTGGGGGGDDRSGSEGNDDGSDVRGNTNDEENSNFPNLDKAADPTAEKVKKPKTDSDQRRKAAGNVKRAATKKVKNPKP